MVDQRFNELREQLLREGVGARHVRRAVSEIEQHFRQLIDERVARGMSEHDARIEAHGALGTNRILVQGYAAQPELRTWSRRWPAIWFTLMPLAGYLALSVTSMVVLVTVVHHMTNTLRHVHIAPAMSHGIDLAARVLFLWFFPWLVAAVFAFLAYRRRVARHWPIAAIAAVSVFVSFLNVSLVLTGGDPPGQVGAGIGVSMDSLPAQAVHAAILAALAYAPLWLAMRRVRQTGTAAD